MNTYINFYMSKESITEFLRRNKGWYNAAELAKILNISKCSVWKSLKTLRESNDIFYKPSNSNNGRPNYKYTL